MDPLRRDDIRIAQETSSGAKLRQALELMEMGLAMKRRKLRAADPDAREEVIEERLLAWMSAPR